MDSLVQRTRVHSNLRHHDVDEADPCWRTRVGDDDQRAAGQNRQRSLDVKLPRPRTRKALVGASDLLAYRQEVS